MKLGFPVRDQFVPEFPVRIGTIYPDISTNRSFKIDYVALSSDGRTVVFVELKTEGQSRRDKQDEYLQAACDTGFPDLLAGLLKIFHATNAKQKYFCLLTYLETLKQLQIPSKMKEAMSRSNLHGVTKLSEDIEITTRAHETLIVYVQPNGDGPDVISFADYRTIMEKHDDPISRRFAHSLKEWAEVQAGNKEMLST